MRIIGLTGGIGCGKSEAGRRFSENGIPVLDADEIAHELIAPGGAAEQAVLDALGGDILVRGRIDRARVAEKVFGHPERLERLNAIMHPLVGMEIGRRCAALAEAGHGTAVVEAALLAEQGRRDDYLQGLILVLCAETDRVNRLVALRRLDRGEALRRIRAQTPPERKIPCADWIIHNDGSLQHLYDQVDAIAKAIREADK
ncbi:MAG TPA: dephospho-CoA kinase [Candidatus Hydrogenedentes bacterium]|nr:dephospho-CoA kinase [Candidatus Hydrogenedentota bacterium]HPC16051.1 dephospho-CoA kinase [Candidatus Hydrogenedentota bacterium]HRT20005.1 dephospho-CoA kinase [Candidatus Hydrogenedentota bacterium]HRT64683.1 dephospho-CoA kinase [Candidatus Hydrogenedentota bacterium]